METNGLYFSPAKGSFLNSPTISPSPLSSPVPDETLPPYPIAFRPTLLRWYLHRSTPWAARTGSSVHARPVAPDIAASTISRTGIAAHFVVFAGVTWLILLGRICLAFKLCILLRKSEFWSEIEREYRNRTGKVGDPLFILPHRTRWKGNTFCECHLKLTLTHDLDERLYASNLVLYEVESSPVDTVG